MLNFVFIGNPQSSRFDRFQRALATFDLPPAQFVPYKDLLAEQVTLHSWDGPNTWFRFDAPERNFATDRGFIAAGAEFDGHHHRISTSQALNLPEDKGRIYHPRQWYLGWQARLQVWTENLQGRLMNQPKDIVRMFDKVQCQQILAEAGIPIPRCVLPHRLAPTLGNHYPLNTYADFKQCLAESGEERVFVKLAHGSSASGVVAYEHRGNNERAITTVERANEDGELRFYNSRKVRRYHNPEHIADIINFLAAEKIQVEAWLPKARIKGREFDLRVVVIGGQARQVAVRLGNSPMTNLHLGSDRLTIADLPKELSADAWATMMRTCERAAACFPQSFYCGIDLLIAPNLCDHYVLEINAFGDLLQDITWQGQDTYTTEIEMLLQLQGSRSC
jgi:glutathione synthase/RimK-type ligase-like ATP-grasp enzyme